MDQYTLVLDGGEDFQVGEAEAKAEDISDGKMKGTSQKTTIYSNQEDLVALSFLVVHYPRSYMCCRVKRSSVLEEGHPRIP
jgi:hypothetical protein